MSRWIQLSDEDTLKAQGRSLHEVDGHSVLLLRTGGEVLAVSARCTHLGSSMAHGRVMAGQLFCPHHGACFDLRSGAALSGPAVLPLPRYAVRVGTSGEIEVCVPESARTRAIPTAVQG